MSEMTRRAVISAAALAPIAALTPALAQTAALADAHCYIIWPQNGTRVKGAFWCRFGLRGMGVTRAGDTTANVGHHHLLVDADEAIVPGEAIPSDKNHLHFGAGQTEARIDLEKGKHTLQLVLGDAEHKPFKPVIASKKITITIY
jgi:hypothetical protein